MNQLKICFVFLFFMKAIFFFAVGFDAKKMEEASFCKMNGNRIGSVIYDNIIVYCDSVVVDRVYLRAEFNSAAIGCPIKTKGFLYSLNNSNPLFGGINVVRRTASNTEGDIIYRDVSLKINTYIYFRAFCITENKDTLYSPVERAMINGYNLKVNDAGMATMCLDYPVAIPDNVDMLGVFYVSSIIDHTLYLRRLKQTIPANCGVIIMANPGTFTFKEIHKSSDIVAQNILSGTTVKVNTADIPGDVYTLGRGVNSGYMGFHKYTGATLPANKAYLVRNADEEEDDVLVIDRSAFDELFDSTTGVTKVVIDGEGQPVIYDLQGRRVEHPSKGIYIVNGKKKYIK